MCPSFWRHWLNHCSAVTGERDCSFWGHDVLLGLMATPSEPPFFWPMACGLGVGPPRSWCALAPQEHPWLSVKNAVLTKVTSDGSPLTRNTHWLPSLQGCCIELFLLCTLKTLNEIFSGKQVQNNPVPLVASTKLTCSCFAWWQFKCGPTPSLAICFV